MFQMFTKNIFQTINQKSKIILVEIVILRVNIQYRQHFNFQLLILNL